MSIKNRREPRVDHKMPVTVHYGNGAQLYETDNVSFRGIFVETKAPIQLNKLVKLTIDFENNTVEFLAIVARRINKLEAEETKQKPGMGLALYSVGNADANIWEDFVQRLYEMDPDARVELEAKQLTKLHLIVDSGPELKAMVHAAEESNCIEYHSQRTLDIGSKHLLTVTHSADPSRRSVLKVVVEELAEENASQIPGYTLRILDDAAERNEKLDLLTIGE